MSRTVRLALASLFFVACADDNDPPTGPTTGSITVSVTTTGMMPRPATRRSWTARRAAPWMPMEA
jgi:hypothetical protein